MELELFASLQIYFLSIELLVNIKGTHLKKKIERKRRKIGEISIIVQRIE